MEKQIMDKVARRPKFVFSGENYIYKWHARGAENLLLFVRCRQEEHV